MLIVKSKLAKHLPKLRNFVEIHLIFEKCNFEQIYLLPKQKQEQENYNSAQKMIEKFEKSWVLLIYPSRLSCIIYWMMAL